MHHNPTIVGPTSDGYYVIYSIGSGTFERDGYVIDCEGPGGVPAVCRPPNSPVWPPCAGRSSRGVEPGGNISGTNYGHEQISLSYATSVAGPWTTKVALPYNGRGVPTAWDVEVSNPTAVLLRNGTVLLVYRGNPWGGGHEGLGVAVAAHWNGTYVRQAGPILGADAGFGNNEDPFAWQDARGHFHIVDHAQSDGNVCSNANVSFDGQGCGAHLFSRDGLTWTVGGVPVYTPEVLLANGETSVLQTRQRPQLVLSSGPTRRPLYLWNGGSFHGGNGDLDHLTHTFVFEFTNL
jgi:hypothetical protein